MLQYLNRQYLREVYRWLIIVAGSAILIFALAQQIAVGVEPRLILLLLLSALVAPNLGVYISRFKGKITFGETFVFLALLIWGQPAAILAAVAETAASTPKMTRRLKVNLYNAAHAAVSVWVTANIMRFIFGEPSQFTNRLSTPMFIVAMCVLSMTHHGVTQTLTAIMQAFVRSWKELRAWLTQIYLWTGITFFVAAAAAGLTVKLIGDLNLLSIAIITPIISLVYFTYHTYLRNLNLLQESEAQFHSSFDYATIGMALVTIEGKWLQVNQSLLGLLGKSETELLDSKFQNSIFAADLEALETKIGGLLTGEFPVFQMEIRLARADEVEVCVLLSASPARDAHNNVRHLILQTQDVTQRKTAEQKLRYDALHDALTGLPNRVAYTKQLEIALAEVNESNEKLLAVMFLDLDGFKLVNDSLGHAAGDELLKQITGRLLECVRDRDLVARLGGDEFSILLENLPDIKQALRIAERIKERLSEPVQLSGQEIFIGVSIGIATTEIKYQAPGEMLRDADAAMYQAKAQGKGCHVIFDQIMLSDVSRQLRLVNDMRRAIERHELVVHYQVVQSLKTNEVCGFEALVRWNHPVYDLLMPSEFIQLAEENGLINQIDNWTLAEACRQMREWQKSDPAYSNLIISVNISTKQFAQPGLVEYVGRILRETGLDPHTLQLEITEGAMLKNLQKTARVLMELKQIGVSIAIDDFGTGYSSLSYLHELPISTLKIDRSFVNRLSNEVNGSKIVQAIVVLARNLEIEVVAEGVETLDQVEQLREMKCDYGQGYFFSRPVSATKAFCLLDSSLKGSSIETPVITNDTPYVS